MSKKSHPSPALGEKILKRILPDIEAESIAGDYEAMYSELIRSKSRLYAWSWYWLQILKSAGVALTVRLYWSFALFHNTMKIAWRNLRRNKVFSIVNIAGLAVGIACCIFIMLWIQDELSWDRFHEDADKIFRVVQRQPSGHITSVTPDALAGHLKAEYPEVIESARYRYFRPIQLRVEDKSFSENPVMADPAFFKIFSFRFLAGDADTALTRIKSMVITDEVAQRLFGDREPLGQTVTLDNSTDFEITGVIENIPSNSSITFDCALPFQLLGQGNTESQWASSSSWTYVRLLEQSTPSVFSQKIAGIVAERNPDNRAQLQLQPLVQLHLRPQGGGGRVIYIYIFSAMAIFILLIASINFINLTTARSAKRSREVGLRKVVGARKSDLVRQFFGESFLFTLTAVVGAVLLTALFLPAFNGLTGKRFSAGADLAGNGVVVLGIIGIVIITGLLAGGYPAFLLSSFQPAKVLRASVNTGMTGRSPILRRILVVIQFSLSIFLMIGTWIIYKQLSFIQSKNLGFDKNHIVCSHSSWGGISDLEAFKEELLNIPGVRNLTFANQKMGEWESGARDDVIWEGKTGNPELTFEVIFCDPDYLDTHRMEMAQGRFFSKALQTDIGGAFLVNEAAVKAMEFGDESPLGKSFSFWDRYRGTIIGVVKDFHTQSLHNLIQPVIFAFDPRSFDNISIRIDSENISATLRALERRWKELTFGYSFEYIFLDENLDKFYRSEQATGTLLRYSTSLAIIISCIGLLGLVAFIAQQRTKEVGIRKVLGASVSSILRLLVKEFALLVLLANLIAWPVAYWAAKQWLENFAYRIDIGPAVFVLSGGIALFIALGTVSILALKTATADPVASLRDE